MPLVDRPPGVRAGLVAFLLRTIERAGPRAGPAVACLTTGLHGFGIAQAPRVRGVFRIRGRVDEAAVPGAVTHLAGTAVRVGSAARHRRAGADGPREVADLALAVARDIAADPVRAVVDALGVEHTGLSILLARGAHMLVAGIPRLAIGIASTRRRALVPVTQESAAAVLRDLLAVALAVAFVLGDADRTSAVLAL